MKSIIFIASIACVLSASLASDEPLNHKVKKAHSELQDHIQENMSGVRMMRGNVYHLVCYNSFTTLINELTAKAKSDSQTCVNEADTKKETELSGLQTKRDELDTKVKSVNDLLKECSPTSVGLEYFECLKNAVEKTKVTLDQIKATSERLISEYAGTVAVIDKSEKECLLEVVKKAKEQSNNVFDKLKSCINLGPVSIEPEITPERNNESNNGNSDSNNGNNDSNNGNNETNNGNNESNNGNNESNNGKNESNNGNNESNNENNESTLFSRVNNGNNESNNGNNNSNNGNNESNNENNESNNGNNDSNNGNNEPNNGNNDLNNGNNE